MRAEFITDTLAAVSRPIRLFRDMLRSQDIDFENDLRVGRLRDRYPAAFAFYDNLYHDYDVNELSFITRRAYHLAGIRNSLDLIGKYVGLEFEYVVDRTDSLEYLDTLDLTTDQKQHYMDIFDGLVEPSDSEVVPELVFGSNYWVVNCKVRCLRQVFKSPSLAVSQLNDLVNELIYHAGDTAHEKNNIRFELLMMEDQLVNMNKSTLSVTQTAFVDKYFDYDNSYFKSLDPDENFSVSFQSSGIIVKYTGKEERYFRITCVYRNISMENASIMEVALPGMSPVSIDYYYHLSVGDKVLSRAMSVTLPYPDVRSGVRYWIYYQEYLPSGDEYVLQNQMYPIGNLLSVPSESRTFTREDCEINRTGIPDREFRSLAKNYYFDLNDVEIEQGLAMSGRGMQGKYGYLIRMLDPFNTNMFYVYYSESDASWKNTGSYVEYGSDLEVPYSDRNISNKLFALVERLGSGDDARLRVYYVATPPYINIK